MYPIATGLGSGITVVHNTGNNFRVATPAAAVEFTNTGSNDVLILPNAILTTDLTTQLPWLGYNSTDLQDQQFKRVLTTELTARGYLLKPTKTVTFRGYAPNHAGPQLQCFALLAVVGATTLIGGVTDVSSQ